ncbi:hypothetical protein D3C71_1583160 [compost metagenome]
MRTRWLRRGRHPLRGRPGDLAQEGARVRRRGEGGVRQPHPAVERWLLPHAKDPLRQGHAHGPAVLLLQLRRCLFRGGHRHADRRKPRGARGHPARRGPQHQPGHRHRADRRRFCAGHGLADHGATGVERQRVSGHARAEHLQDPGDGGHPPTLQGGTVARGQPGRQRGRQQGGGRAAVHAGDQCVRGAAQCGGCRT